MEEYRFIVAAEDTATAGRYGQALADTLREVQGVVEVDRRKADESTMELGTILVAIASSGATLALAQGVAAWLRARRGASLTIEIDGATGSIKVAVAGIDPESAIRITELVKS